MNKKQDFNWNKKWGSGNEPSKEEMEKKFEEETGIPVSFHWVDNLGKIVSDRSKAKRGIFTPKKFVKKEVSVEVIKQKGKIIEDSKQISWGKLSDRELISNSRNFSNVTQRDLHNNNNGNPLPIFPIVGAVGLVASLGFVVYKVRRNKIKK